MPISRVISPLIPKRLHGPVKKARYFLNYEFGVRLLRRDPLLPPVGLYPVGAGNYKKIGEEFFGYFTTLAGLQPTDRVLDIGCGTARMARPLTRYLTAGTYDGLDISRPAIEWCRKVYTRRFPNFRFHFADIQNGFFNPQGRQPPDEYRFPFPDATFDFVFLTSVFTHMLPLEVENYIAEIARVMKPAGQCLATFFLLTPESQQLVQAGLSDLKISLAREGYFTADANNPEYAVGYPEETIRELYSKHELEIVEPVRFGSWSGRKDGLSYQDIVVATRSASD